MKKNMHIRTLAIVVATLTSAQISGVATSMTEKHNVAYAAENSEQANDLSLQLSNAVALSVDSTTGQSVTPQPDPFTTKAIKSVYISGTERVGKTLTANVDYNTGVVIPSVKYQWLKCSSSDGTYHEISGATDSEYKLDSDDRDDYIKVRVTSTINDTDTITSSRTGDISKKSSSSSSSSKSSTADSDEIESDITNADSNEIVKETIYDEPKIKQEVFETLQNHSDITLDFVGDDYEWIFKGKDIKDPSALDGRLDTRIDTTSPNESDIKKLTNGVDVVNLYFNHNGKLPGKAEIKYNIGSDYNGNSMYVYYYNDDTKQLELVQSGVRVKDGNIEFTIEHCSDYVLSKVPILGAKGNDSINNVAATTQSQNQWKQLNDGTWQYIENGSLVKGWKYINSKWYYMNENGVMQTNWLYDGGKWYYLNSDGEMATEWKQLGSTWYYLGSDGVMLTGWICLGGNWYYLDSNGAMVTGSKVINGQRYLFNDSGIWQ